MSRPSKREIECYYFEQFRRDYELPAGRIKYADKPDVRIIGQKTVGIELARLYLIDGKNPVSEQVQRQRREDVLLRAQELYRRKGLPMIELNVDFDPCDPIEDVDEMAAEVTRLAEGMAGRVGRSVRAPCRGIRFAHHNGAEYSDAKWHVLQFYETPQLDERRLEQVVEDKGSKAVGYDKCDTYWLLLVIDLMDRAQDQEISFSPSFRLTRNPYSRVLLYWPQFGQVWEVPRDD